MLYRYNIIDGKEVKRMTSIPANVQNFLAGNRAGQPKTQAPESRDDFSKVLDRQKTTMPKEKPTDASRQVKPSSGDTGGTQEQTEVPKETDGDVQKVGEEVSSEETVTGQNQQESVEAVDQPGQEVSDGPLEGELSGEELEQVMAILQSAVLQIQELLMQQLDISPQELEQLLQREGFTDLQLLQPETVNQLILAATGAEDSVALVTDENLYQSQQTIIQGFQEITRELKNSLQEQLNLSDDDDLPKALEVLENAVNGKSVTVVPETGVETVSGPRGLLQESGQPQQDGRQSDGEQNRDQKQGVAGQVFFQNYSSPAQNQAAAQVSPVNTGTGTAYVELPESQQVMNQILDYMKVSMKPEDTILNMQLHPENLGTLHIQITAREGIMTAHFTASSEAVKSVLETQMVVLKENLEQQDIKVDAIEVTVETHQFESNLEQGRQRGEEESGRKPRRRRLNIGSLESEEELTQPDQVLSEMMAQSGSSVDYLV